MNIFVTSKCPIESAKALDDKRCIKMCLESTQLLCNALNACGVQSPYRTTHANHPCSKWASENRSNWVWLWRHAIALCEEYGNRYGKVHKCYELLQSMFKFHYELPIGKLTPFVNCAKNSEKGIDFTRKENVHIAYQLYLDERWARDKREPTWYGIAK